MVKTIAYPRHTLLIMDGNGRFANRSGQQRTTGHKSGADALENLISYFGKSTGVKYLTAFAFAEKNYQRAHPEVSFLHDLGRSFCFSKMDKLHTEGVRVRFVGNLEDGKVPEYFRRAARSLEWATKECTKLNLQIAWNYSGRDELRRALEAGWEPEQLYETMFDAQDVPPIELVLRTGVDNSVGLNYRDSDCFPLLTAEHAVQVPFAEYWPALSEEHVERAFATWRAENKLDGGQRVDQPIKAAE